ncbi:uncharacterized protein N7496_007965 [Penicillium cataractarum]|uniref:Uncharacterized protein n=1 Tax=Penicillium cataractarum TaxID=2100454 RepID=A0A9W9RYU5_9EURO|nr:uncharacterized protein N7496_007965 [Penicillium cataractarum]KAJ5368205.1 hypothetical protein N7496_007965 [Penicillium cataractarum]
MISSQQSVIDYWVAYDKGDSGQIAFMRIYYQIPITGTEDADLATLAQQIQPPEVCGELEAFKQLMSQGCSSDLVPGGYIKYLVWEKVPGEALTEEFFWSLDLSTRDDIRSNFRVAFESGDAALRCKTTQESRISKIIYDQSTGNVYVKDSSLHTLGIFTNEFSRISGFRRGWPIRDPLEWSDTRYVAYTLAKPPNKKDWRSRRDEWEL